MKKWMLGLMLIVMVMFTGCATTKIATDIGVNIGKSYQESALKGTISAEQSILAWPYISGTIKGVMASEYDLMLSGMSIDIIKRLDELAKKETLTTEEKGLIIGYFVRLEIVAIKDNWDNYGVSIFNMVIKTITP